MTVTKNYANPDTCSYYNVIIFFSFCFLCFADLAVDVLWLFILWVFSVSLLYLFLFFSLLSFFLFSRSLFILSHSMYTCVYLSIHLSVSVYRSLCRFISLLSFSLSLSMHPNAPFLFSLTPFFHLSLSPPCCFTPSLSPIPFALSFPVTALQQKIFSLVLTKPEPPSQITALKFSRLVFCFGISIQSVSYRRRFLKVRALLGPTLSAAFFCSVLSIYCWFWPQCN